MALLDNCPSSLQRLWAFVHLFAHPSLAVSHTLWQKETLKHREAEAVSAAGSGAEPPSSYQSGIPSTCSAYLKGQDCVYLPLNPHF